MSGTHYRWQIVTVCDNGSYVPVSFATLNAWFTTVGDICEIPVNRQENVALDNNTTFSWNPVDGAVTYKIRYTEVSTPIGNIE